MRVGRYGPYLQQGTPEDGRRASLPDDLAPDELTPAKVEELLDAPSGDRELGTTGDGREITAKSGRYGPYVTDGERTASLFKSMSLDTVTLEEAEQLLTLPRTLGQLDGEDVTAQNGRYGPYIKKGTDSRSIESEEQLFTITLDEAAAILAQPKQRGRRAAAAPPLRELGVDPVSEQKMVIKDGRFGPYVTDGETNASLRKGDAVESITDDRASELLADRRARGPAKKAPRKAAARKSPAKKAAAKKTAAKKTAAKKTPPRRLQRRRPRPRPVLIDGPRSPSPRHARSLVAPQRHESPRVAPLRGHKGRTQRLLELQPVAERVRAVEAAHARDLAGRVGRDVAGRLEQCRAARPGPRRGTPGAPCGPARTATRRRGAARRRRSMNQHPPRAASTGGLDCSAIPSSAP